MSTETRTAELIDRHLDDLLTVDEAAELNRCLAESAEARDLFWRMARVHARLRQWGEQQLGELREPAVATGRRSRRWFWSALAAVLLLGVGTLVWLSVGTHGPAPARMVAEFGPFERVRWVGLQEPREGEAIRAGQRVEIASGKVRIDFASGATVTLVGPAVLDVESELSAYLELGQLLAKADTPQSRGFTVRTRTSRVLDLGTEFTAESAADGQSRVGVVSGAVEVSAGGQQHLLRSGDMLLVEPGPARVVVRIERGDETPAFRFPTIEPPSDRDYADARQGHARVTVAKGTLAKHNLQRPESWSGPAEVLLDGRGQRNQDVPNDSVFFSNNSDGKLLLDLGSPVSISKINSYSWHQNGLNADNRLRAQQNYTLYGCAGATPPTVDDAPEAAGWVQIARVNSDEYFNVVSRLDRPAQQGCSITSASGTLGRYRYLLLDVKPSRYPDFKLPNHTFYGELDVYAQP